MRPFQSLTILLLTTGIAVSQHKYGPGPGGATAGYEAAMAAMHHDLAVPPSGDADRDFLAGMIPHHEGAIAMARILLAHGRDAETRRLAETIIADQER